MSDYIENIHLSMSRGLSGKDQSESPVMVHRKPVKTDINSKDGQLCPSKIDDPEFGENRETIQGEERDSSGGMEDGEVEPPNTCTWWSSLCCLYKLFRSRQPVLERSDVPLGLVVEQMEDEKQTSTDFLIELIKLWQLRTPLAIAAPPKPKGEPVLLSRRGDVLVVVGDENRVRAREIHQYFRSSWRLKPSVIGAPETLGYED